jgi:MauM/NapG family ferredoxin protein
MPLNLLRVLERLLDPRPPLRPPGAVAEREFVRRCIKCNKCAQICPYGSVRMGRIGAGSSFGTPYIVARDMPCYVCMLCPPVCPTGALDRDLTRLEEVRMGVAVIDESKCFAYNGIICRSCFERCPVYREAITLRGEHYPVVQPEACIGCGICENVCPMEEPAITVHAGPRNGGGGRPTRATVRAARRRGGED